MARTHFGRQASGNGWLDGLQLGRAGKARAALGAQCGGRRCAVRTDLARSEKGRMADAAQGAAGPMFMFAAAAARMAAGLGSAACTVLGV